MHSSRACVAALAASMLGACALVLLLDGHLPTQLVDTHPNKMGPQPSAGPVKLFQGVNSVSGVGLGQFLNASGAIEHDGSVGVLSARAAPPPHTIAACAHTP
mmetsp:Transcript_12438/g.32527  ORF Transcript_12438/g.32527 Transcript_12438/m.32527 type:complete len:102 (+) Transcript_12438:30-335(+)